MPAGVTRSITVAKGHVEFALTGKKTHCGNMGVLKMGRFIDSSKSVQMLWQKQEEKGRDSSLHETLTDTNIINKKFTKLGGKNQQHQASAKTWSA